MAWKRRGRNAYYYESRREDGRVVSAYLGKGVLAECVSTRLRLRHEWKVETRRAEAERRRLVAWWDRELRQIVSEALELAAAAMHAAGYYRHDRGRWRKRRSSTVSSESSSERAPASKAPANPDRLAEVFACGLDNVVNHEIAQWFCGTDEKGAKARQLMQAETVRMAASLAGPDPTPAVRALANVAALTWAEMSGLSCSLYARTERARSVDQIAFAERRYDKAHRRFIRVMKALADVKRVTATYVQVNHFPAPPPG